MPRETAFSRDDATANAITHAALLKHSIEEKIAIGKEWMNSIGSAGAMANTLAPQRKAKIPRAKRALATAARPVPTTTSFDTSRASNPARMSVPA
ncbi:hypothetical protein ACFFYR_38160 [Paraburkholderia dipogonis]|uniref:hypothetical protein n=1 Tax=Paraburkholderia dipogonis TaxID=1211383 RepID=UPI0035EC61FF